MEHFTRKKIKLPYESIMRATYGLHAKGNNASSICVFMPS